MTIRHANQVTQSKAHALQDAVRRDVLGNDELMKMVDASMAEVEAGAEMVPVETLRPRK